MIFAKRAKTVFSETGATVWHIIIMSIGFFACSSVHCPTVKERMNGKISAKDGKFGVLHCHEGYMMTGSNVTICKNKTWIRLLGKFTQDESTHSTPGKNDERNVLPLIY